MDWIIFSLLSVFFFSSSALFQRVLMKEESSDPYPFAIAFQLIGTVITAAFAFAHGFTMVPIAEYPIHWLALTSLWGLSTFCLFNAYKYIEASEVTIIGSSRAIVTIVAAIIILGEVFNLQRFVGTVLILISAYIVSQVKHGLK